MIHVLDGLVVRPGALADVRRRLDDEYAPLLAGIGMRRVHTWIAPAVELVDRPTELLVLWEVEGVDAYWAAKRAAAADPAVARFWAVLDPLLTGRTRRIMCDPADPTLLG